MTGRQMVGVYIFVGMALVLLRVLPRTSLYSRLLLTRWDVRRKERFGQPGRRDFVRYAFYCLSGGVALAALAVFGLGRAMEHVRPLSRAETWLSGLAFGGLIISAMCALGALVLLIRAAVWKPLPPMAFLICRDDEPIGETQLEHESLEHGIVSGGVRPLPSFAEFAPAVKDVSDAIVRSPDVATAMRLVASFSRDHAMRIIDQNGDTVDAHSVMVVDLSRLKVGRGFWAEVSLRDVNAWQAGALRRSLG